MMELLAKDDVSRFQKACDWFLRLREAPESPDLVLEWLEWCRSDPRNRAAFEEVRDLWQTSGMIPAEDVPARHAVVPARRWRVSSLLAAAAALVLAIGAGWFMARQPFAQPSMDAATAVFSTARSEHRSFKLADGSLVELAGDSELRATLHSDRRQIELRGEAYFRVAHDTARPFIVHAGTLHVRAVGTSFDVRTSDDRVVVAVEEGLVVVEPQPVNPIYGMLTRLRSEPDAAALRPVHVRGGQEIAVGVPDRELQVLNIEPKTVASWRAGRLRFVREPLRSVVASIRASTGHDIALADPELGELRFTGTVFSSHIDSWVEGLPAVFPLTVHQEGARMVLTARK